MAQAEARYKEWKYRITLDSWNKISYIMFMRYLILFLFLLTSLPSLACQCGIIDERQIEKATTIFEGKPFSRSKSPNGGMIQFLFTVSKVWKGEAVDTFMVSSLVDDCFTSDFEMSKEYIVFAYRNSTNTCTFNSPLESSHILGLLRYRFDEEFKERLGKNNRKKLNEEEAFYLNSKFKKEKGKLDFCESKVLFLEHEKKIRKQAYFAQRGGTLYYEKLIVLGPLSRWFIKADALIIVNPIRDYEKRHELEWLLIRLKRE